MHRLVGLAVLSASVLLAPGHTVRAAGLDVDFVVTPDDQAAGCASSTVAGLDPSGDGFLAVRSGPGTQFRMIGQLHNGAVVRTCAAEGPWVGVLFGAGRAKGWVHGRWLAPLAG